jgi:protein-tyrosine phosphatase
MYRITTVCTGNICRSPMAEYLIRQAVEEAGITDVEVDSAGTSDWEIGNPADPRAIELLVANGIDASSHTARQFDGGTFATVDLVLALDADHYAELRKLAPTPEDKEKVRMLRSFDPQVADLAPAEQGIYDPWFGDSGDFDAAWEMIRAALPGLVRHVRQASAETSGA